MLYFYKCVIVRGEQLYVPHFMRATLALHEGTPISILRISSTGSVLGNQVQLSAVPQERAADVWNLKASFRDRPGILKDILGILASNKIDILNCTAATRFQNREFVVDIDFDAQLYQSRFDLNAASRQEHPHVWLKELYARIFSHFVREMSLRDDGRPNIYLKKNHLLATSRRMLEHKQSNGLFGGRLSLSHSLLEEIRSEYLVHYPEIANLRGDAKYPRAMLVADPEFKTLLATIFYRNTGHAHLRVESASQPGTLRDLTAHLLEYGFNILQANTRIVGSGGRSLCDFFVHLPRERDKVRNDEHLRRFIRSMFYRKQVRDLKCRISFPKPATADEMKNDQNQK